MSNELAPINGAGEAGVSVRQEFGSTEIVRGAETAMAAMAAQSKALVEARFVVAMRCPRKWPNIRISVNQLCKDPGFAAEALYVKPLTATPEDWQQIDKRERLRRRLDGKVKDWPMGFSIRFIEAVLFECGNFDVDATIIWEDEDKRITLVSVIDLERNSAYKRTVTTAKTVERSYLKKNEEPLSVRTNTNGQMVYLLPANAQQIETSEAAGVSKALRTMGERLLPPHYKAEWRAIIERTILDQAAKDPEGEKKKLFDAFAEKGVLPSSLEQYLEHPVAEMQPAELAALRKIFVAVSSGEVTWRDVMESKFGASGDDDKPTQSPGAAKVTEILNRKREPKTATTSSSPQASGAPPAGPQNASPSSGQPGSLQDQGPQQSTPASTPPQPAEECKQQPSQPAPASSPLRPEPPVDLPHFDEWPDALDNEFYWVGDVLYAWNEEAGSYRKHSDRPFQAPKPVAEPQPAKRQFNFNRRPSI